MKGPSENNRHENNRHEDNTRKDRIEKLRIFDKFSCLRRMKSRSKHDYSDTLVEYYQLSMKRGLSKTEGDRIESILSRCQCDQELRILVSMVDELTYQNLDYFSAASLEATEKVRVKALEKILCGDATNLERPEGADVEPPETLAQALPLVLQSDYAPRRRRFRRLLLHCSVLALGGAAFVGLAGLVKGHPTSSLFANTSTGNPMSTEAMRALKENSAHKRYRLVSAQRTLERNQCAQKTAAWTDPARNGRQTAYLSTFFGAELTAAHSFLPPGSKVLLSAGEREVEVEINDKIASSPDTDIVLSYEAAYELDMVEDGRKEVEIKEIELEEGDLSALDSAQADDLDTYTQQCRSYVAMHGQQVHF